MPDLTAVILAAGQGTRMRSQLPKMLHPLCGRALVAWPIAAAREAGARSGSSSSTRPRTRSTGTCRTAWRP